MISSENRKFLTNIRKEVDSRISITYQRTPGQSKTRPFGKQYWGYYLEKNGTKKPWIFFGWAEEFEEYYKNDLENLNTPFWIELDVVPSQRFIEIEMFNNLLTRTHPRDSRQIIIPISCQESGDDIAERIVKIAEETL